MLENLLLIDYKNLIVRGLCTVVFIGAGTNNRQDGIAIRQRSHGYTLQGVQGDIRGTRATILSAPRHCSHHGSCSCAHRARVAANRAAVWRQVTTPCVSGGRQHRCSGALGIRWVYHAGGR